MIKLQQAGIKVPVMLTVDEVHKAFRLSKQFTYQLAKSGKVRAVRAGNRFLLNAESVSEFLNSHTLTDEQSQPMPGIHPVNIR